MGFNITTATEIGNLALRNLGQSKTMIDIDTDRSANGREIAAWYRNCLEAKLRNFRWSFATKFKDLALLTVNPTSEWNYLYQLPDDCAEFRRILSTRRLIPPWGLAGSASLSVTRQDNIETEVPKLLISDMADGVDHIITAISKATECQVTSDSHGLVDGQLVLFAITGGMLQLDGITAIVSDSDDDTFKIKNLVTGEYIDSSLYTAFTEGTCGIASSSNVLTDQQDAQAEYGYICTDVNLFPVDFSISLAWDIAFCAGPVIVGLDRVEVINRAGQMAEYWERRARTKNKNEGGSDVPPLPDGAQARL